MPACWLCGSLAGWPAGMLACWSSSFGRLFGRSFGCAVDSCLLIVSFRLGFEPDPAELKHTMAPRRRARESGQGRSTRKDLGRQGKHYRTPAGVRRQPFVFRSGCTLCSEASTNSLPRGSTQAQPPAARMIMDKSLKFVRGRGREASAPASHRQRPPSNIYGLLLPLRRGTAHV